MFGAEVDQEEFDDKINTLDDNQRNDFLKALQDAEVLNIQKFGDNLDVHSKEPPHHIR